jgi:hypothetical protein
MSVIRSIPALLVLAVSLAGCGSSPTSATNYAGSWAGTSNEGQAVSLVVTGAQVTQFSMPVRLRHGSISCTATMSLQEPSVIVGDKVTLKAEVKAAGLANMNVDVTFSSDRAAAGSSSEITGGGLFCGGSFSLGSSQRIGGPWSFNASKAQQQ